MQDYSDSESEVGYVECARCGTECALAQIPQLACECSTLEGTQEGSVLDVTPETSSNTVIELSCDWAELEDKIAA